MRTSLQSEIATGASALAMTNIVAFPCHCHEALCRAGTCPRRAGTTKYVQTWSCLLSAAYAARHAESSCPTSLRTHPRRRARRPRRAGAGTAKCVQIYSRRLHPQYPQGACPTIFLQVELLQAIRANQFIPARGRKLELFLHIVGVILKNQFIPTRGRKPLFDS